jgi:hypothetical protein
VLKQLFWHASVWFKCNRWMNRWSRHRIVRCWRCWALTLTVDKPWDVGWTDACTVGSSDGLFWILWPQNSSDASRIEGVGSSEATILIYSSNLEPLSFPSILLLQPCFHEHFELVDNQGTWVCIFSWLLVHGQATSARTPLNSTVKHYKLAIQVSFISLWHLELSKSLAL